jgi:heat shock protein 5
MTKDNHLLGTFELSGIAAAPRGQPQIEVTFDIDVNGILTVRAEDKGSGQAEEVTITSDKGRLSEEEIERMVKEAEEMAEEDKAAKARVESKNGLESFVYSIKNQIREDDEKSFRDKLEPEEVEEIEAAIKETIEWLDDNMDADKEQFDEKKEELEKVVHPIFKKFQGQQAGGEGGDYGGEDEEMPDHDEL